MQLSYSSDFNWRVEISSGKARELLSWESHPLQISDVRDSQKVNSALCIALGRSFAC